MATSVWEVESLVICRRTPRGTSKNFCRIILIVGASSAVWSRER